MFSYLWLFASILFSGFRIVWSTWSRIWCLVGMKPQVSLLVSLFILSSWSPFWFLVCLKYLILLLVFGDRHNTVAELNRLMRSQTSNLDTLISIDNTYKTNDKNLHRFTSTQKDHTLTKMDGNIIMDSTIAVSMNVHTRVVNFLLAMKVEFVWLKTYFFS